MKNSFKDQHGNFAGLEDSIHTIGENCDYIKICNNPIAYKPVVLREGYIWNIQLFQNDSLPKNHTAAL